MPNDGTRADANDANASGRIIQIAALTATRN